MPTILAILIVFGACDAGESGRTAESRRPTPSLLLVTIDTWRWDHVGVSGSGKVSSPNLDRLAANGIYESEAVTSCPLTTPAHASLFTGAGLARHEVWDCTRYRLAAKLPTLAEGFRSAGYHTAGFVAAEPLRKRYGLDRGFELYDESGIQRRGGGDWMAASRDGTEITAAAITDLRRQPAGRGVMLWVHYFDLHRPYRPRPAFDSRHPGHPYRAQVEFVDSQIGELLTALRADPSRSWRICVVGDHGEGLGERGEETHGIGLYRATLHVPLILHPKPERPLVHAKPWGLVDIAPTLREWFGLPVVSGIDGDSLFRRGARQRTLVSVSIEPTLLFGVKPTIGVRTDRFQYLRSGEEELYDLAVDPGEEHDLSGTAPEVVARLRSAFTLMWPGGWLRKALLPSMRPTARESNALHSLGYITGESSTRATLREAGIESLLRDRSDWEAAREQAFRTGRSDALLAVYARLVASYPESFALHKAYGTLLAKEGIADRAATELGAALALNPGDVATLTNLGTVHLMLEKVDAARKYLGEAVKLEPDNPIVHKNLGILYADHLSDPKMAVVHYKKYLEAGGDAEADRIRAYCEEQRGRALPTQGQAVDRK